MKEGLAIISCDVFLDELEFFTKKNSIAPLVIKYFEVFLHNTPDKLRGVIQELISEVDREFSPKNILLLCGLCGNATIGLYANRSTLIIPRVHECISIFLGSTERYMEVKKKYPRCYFCSPGWNRSKLLPGRELDEKVRLDYEEKYSEDKEMADDLFEMFKSQYKEYTGYLYSDFSLKNREANLDICKENAEYLGWSVTELEGDSSLFEDALLGNWDEKRFLKVHSGERIEPEYRDGKIFYASKSI